MLQPSGASMPRPLVQFACGSRSTRSTRWPRSARAAERFRAVVVLPTPPFWLAMATTFMRKGRELGGHTVTGDRTACNQNRRASGNHRRRRKATRLPRQKSQKPPGSGTLVDAKIILAAFGITRSYGGGMQICPGADHSDGLLDITMVASGSRLKLIRLFPTVFKGTHIELDEVSTARARTVTVDSPGINAYADGDFVGPLPAEISAVSGAVQIFVRP